MTLPLGDWQFWVVTAVVAGSVWLRFRPLGARARSSTNATCSHCSVAGEACARTHGPATTAAPTVERLVTLGRPR
jgi:hypothetical protein